MARRPGRNLPFLSSRRFGNCVAGRITGFTSDGGYAEYMVAPREAVASMPESLDPGEAAPLLCAGITTFNALRHSGAMPGDLVAVQGIGALGHLGVQFASKFGYRVLAISRGKEARFAEMTGVRPMIEKDPLEKVNEACRRMLSGRAQFRVVLTM
jgi:D-arabinose 1-dehydrogenase-like Zn-dependent alcohol dehydrogenase